jgi:hypothetical protein
VIVGLRSLFNELEFAVGIVSSVGDYSQEKILRHVIRAGATHQNAAWIQQFDRAQIYFFVAARRRVDTGAVLRKGGRIQDDRVEAFAASLHLAQRIENICLAEFNVRDVVQLGILAR